MPVVDGGYLYGPWTAQYDEALDRLAAAGKIQLNHSDRGGKEAVFVSPTVAVELSAVFPHITDELRAR